MQLHPETSVANGFAEREADSPTAHPAGNSRLRRRLGWAGAITALVLLLVFGPPLINANRYRRQIATSMSASLGRPVHLDSVSLRMLPLPGLTLTNLVVSENPAFGAEPTIRANTVEATLRLGSLWRRRVEFSTVRFVEPSVNLVRNAEGRWNLSEILLHASHVDTAPTVQRKAGPAPRFPYIEATGGRINIKLGEEKLPYSLTDADFALWLPSPQQWRVRLEGQPARTDTYITDPGTLRIEGALQRASALPEVPVNLRATWHDAPTGEATRLLTGEDWGWRGLVNLDMSLQGTLGASQAAAKLTLGGVRRAEFAPAHPLDLQVTCRGGLAITEERLTDLSCAVPDSAPTPLLLQTAALSLQHPEQAQVAVTADKVPLHWGLLWAALFSARVPTDLFPAGSMALSLQHTALQAPALQAAFSPAKLRTSARAVETAVLAPPAHGTGRWSGWTGTLSMVLPPAPASPGVAAPSSDAAPSTTLVWKTAPTSATAGPSLQLASQAVHLGPEQSVNVRAAISGRGYDVSVDGNASPAALLLPSRYLPQLGDGLDTILPFPPTRTAALRVEFTCTHPWGALQTCTSSRPLPAGTKPAAGAGAPSPAIRPAPGADSNGNAPPTLLTPQSLSPFDHHSPLGGTPSSPRF